MSMSHAWVENERFAECRTLTGHRWRATGEFALDGGDMYVGQRCGCGTRRHRWYHWITGELKASWYDYPDGYLENVKNGKRPSRVELRSVYFKRIVKERGSAMRKAEHPVRRYTVRKKAAAR